MAMIERKCNKCGEVKPLDEFPRDKRARNDRRNPCKECQSEYQKQYRQANKEKIKELQRQRRLANKEELKEYQKEYQKNRKANDRVFALRKNIGTQVRNMLKRTDGSKQGESVLQYLPYTIEQLWDHLRSLYTEGMTDENYGEWHVDHIIPQSKLLYDSMDHPNFLKCWALSNLQPLWAHENMSKGDKVI